MLILKSVLLGLIEGVTEFLPISSTAHLLLFSRFFNLPADEYWKFFAVFIQSGAILAVVTIYWRQLFDRRLWVKLMASFVPTMIVGFVLYKLVKTFFFDATWLIAVSLIGFGWLFLWLENRIANKQLILKQKVKQLTFPQAVVLGLLQAVAMVPGVSRAGVLLIGGMFMGYKREEVAQYSFWLAVPTILVASVYDLIKTNPAVILNNWHLTLIGFTTAYLSALVVIRWLIGYLQKNDLTAFAYYRICIGITLLLILLFNA